METVKAIKSETVKIKIWQDDVDYNEFYEFASNVITWHRHYKIGTEHDFKNPQMLLCDLLEHFSWAEIEDFVIKNEVATIEFDEEEGTHDVSFFGEYVDSISNDYYGRNGVGEMFFDELYKENISVKIGDFIEFLKQKFVILPVYLFDHSGLRVSTTPFSCSWDSGQIGYAYMSKKHEDYLNDEQALSLIKAEVEMIDDCISGNVYGFTTYETKTCKCCNHTTENTIDSGGGFIGNIKDNGIIDAIVEVLTSEQIEEFGGLEQLTLKLQ